MKEPLPPCFKPSLKTVNRPARLIQRCAAAVVLLCATSAPSDSLWRDDSAANMFSDKRATRVGDIVTILVQENSTATKDNSTKTSKQSNIDAAIASFLFSPGASGLMTQKGKLPALKLSGKSDFNGGGSINNSQKIVSSVAVRVVDVLPNRNLVIEGTRESAFSGEQQTIVLRGTIRQDDVMANNTVYSYNIADATIKIVSKGTITDSQRKGWFQKFWDKLSPF
jgi:flagellar L-ring protein precursor FlgH